jgi:hypothetical protein
MGKNLSALMYAATTEIISVALASNSNLFSELKKAIKSLFLGTSDAFTANSGLRRLNYMWWRLD